MVNKPIPPKALDRLANLIRDRDALNARIDEQVLTLREAMGVPDDWVIRSLDEGFISPPTDTASTVAA